MLLAINLFRIGIVSAVLTPVSYDLANIGVQQPIPQDCPVSYGGWMFALACDSSSFKHEAYVDAGLDKISGTKDVLIVTDLDSVMDDSKAYPEYYFISMYDVEPDFNRSKQSSLDVYGANNQRGKTTQSVKFRIDQNKGWEVYSLIQFKVGDLSKFADFMETKADEVKPYSPGFSYPQNLKLLPSEDQSKFFNHDIMIGFEDEINSDVYQDDLWRIVKKTNITYEMKEETVSTLNLNGTRTTSTRQVQVMTAKVDRINFYQKVGESFVPVKELKGAEEKYTDLMYAIISRKIEKGDKKVGSEEVFAEEPEEGRHYKMVVVETTFDDKKDLFYNYREWQTYRDADGILQSIEKPLVFSKEQHYITCDLIAMSWDFFSIYSSNVEEINYFQLTGDAIKHFRYDFLQGKVLKEYGMVLI